MATIQIPTRTDLGLYRMQVDLDGETFIFDFQFNEREGAWYFDIADEAGNPIRSGIKVVTGFPLTRLIRDLRWRGGVLVAVDTTGQSREAVIDTLGSEVVLTYVEAADAPAMERV
jgi:hypothetical protein